MLKFKKQFSAFMILNLMNLLFEYYPYEKLHEISQQLTGNKEFFSTAGRILQFVLTGIIPIFFVFLMITLREYLYGKINLLKAYTITIAVALTAILFFYLINQLFISAALFITSSVFIFILLDYGLRSIIIKFNKNRGAKNE